MSAPTAAVAHTRIQRVRHALTVREWWSIGGMTAFVVALHVVGWGVLIAVVRGAHSEAEAAGALSIGLGVTAYTLGLRHAFDADHIAAIDNTTRKLMDSGRRPLSVGFWFSLGHSSIVFGLCALLAIGVRVLMGHDTALTSTLGIVGTSVSGVFLYAIGILNLVILVGIVKVFLRMRRGSYDEAQLEKQLQNRGGLNRVFGRVTKVISKPPQMYFVGLLFGLGFDTATEVSLLFLAGGAAAIAMPWYAIMTLPVLFAAGMSLLDSIDGCFMNFAYGWAFSKPVRKVYYNMVITTLSVAVALIIGSVELVSILVDRAGITAGPLAAIGGIDLNHVGYAIVAVFAIVWAIALGAWRFGHIEERWAGNFAAPAQKG